ncbi:GMP/IMP nucleotidase [Methylomarinum vadi]|uniref:GMP/IMP nucleotidase n=1 Tax=Methylomarinum vadi TaxID=438855 RepID=UPI0004DFC56B|nr:GMP/IMP nucleotidase [Methylomarinum vadi]
MLNWKKIDTVLLDMDGTLLDLNFDNHFWNEFVPQKYAENNGLSVAEAKQLLAPRFKALEGKLEWYCLDYWSQTLDLDIAGLKLEIAGLISVLPHVTEFLDAVKSSPRQLLLVTNAHRDSLRLKMDKTSLNVFFDQIICSHDFGMAKEQQGFWRTLQERHVFEKQRTLLVDDSLAVLNAAKEFGIGHLISISKPDSRAEKRTITQFPAIEDFRELMPIR